MNIPMYENDFIIKQKLSFTAIIGISYCFSESENISIRVILDQAKKVTGIENTTDQIAEKLCESRPYIEAV
jgi:hypothetical protein